MATRSVAVHAALAGAACAGPRPTQCYCCAAHTTCAGVLLPALSSHRGMAIGRSSSIWHGLSNDRSVSCGWNRRCRWAAISKRSRVKWCRYMWQPGTPQCVRCPPPPHHARASLLEKRSFPQGGAVAATEHTMHLHCEGEGSPPVIFMHGYSGQLRDWSHIQPAVARHTRACAFVSRSCACIGSPCLRHCVHGASISTGPLRLRRLRPRPAAAHLRADRGRGSRAATSARARRRAGTLRWPQLRRLQHAADARAPPRARAGAR
jgi:hypothetical protein